MSKALSRLLCAGVFAAVPFLPAPASARVEHTPERPLCGASVCTTAQLRDRVRTMRKKVVRLRDQRGLLDIRLRPADLRGTTADLALERAVWAKRLADVKASKPLWRKL